MGKSRPRDPDNKPAKTGNKSGHGRSNNIQPVKDTRPPPSPPEKPEKNDK